MSDFGHGRIVPFPINVTPEQFLRAIFGERWGDAQVAYFPGNPHPSNPLRNWTAKPAATELPKMKPTDNCYWNVSLPIARAGGRTNADFAELRTIVLDDVGVKVDRAKVVEILGREPHLVVETSPGSYQAGWIIEPIADLAWTWGLLRALHAAVGGDNLKKPMTFVRLPMGVNGKPQYAAAGGAGFRVRLVEWRPEQPWIARVEWPPIEALLGGIIAKMPGVTDRLGLKKPSIDEVEADPVYRVFRDQGRLLDEGHMGTIGWCYNVLCPWSADGGHDDPSGTAYFPIRREFTCHHGHCIEERRSIEDVHDWANAIIKEESGGLLNRPAFDFDDIAAAITPGQRALGSYEQMEAGAVQAFVGSK